MSLPDPIAEARAAGRLSLGEDGARRLLSAAGVPFPRDAVAGTPADAAAAARTIGFPVAAKGEHPDVLHKTEAGLVRLDLGDEGAVEAAAAEMLARMPPGGRILVQEMVRGARELIAGMVRDPTFGPCVSVGIGGVFAEPLGDVVFRRCPLGRAEALAALEDLRLAALLGPFRGMPPVDRDAVAEIILALSDLALARPEIAEIDLNPLVVAGARPVAVDALVLLAPA